MWSFLNFFRNLLLYFVRFFCLNEYFVEGESLDGKKDASYDPWPHYRYTGKLKPFEQTPKRAVPAHIGRPDYADHPKGYPLSEQAVKGSSQIRVLDDEEIEGTCITI